MKCNLFWDASWKIERTKSKSLNNKKLTFWIFFGLFRIEIESQEFITSKGKWLFCLIALIMKFNRIPRMKRLHLKKSEKSEQSKNFYKSTKEGKFIKFLIAKTNRKVHNHFSKISSSFFIITFRFRFEYKSGWFDF